jgi:pimeloyl-ACP methyl ester carboxylesterase
MKFIVQGYPAYAYTGGRPYDPALPAIVFIHGGAFDHSVWQWQSRYFAHHGFAVLAVDLPGHGRSPGIPRTTIEAMADWVAAFIEVAGHERANVVGHSMGSLVALDTALRHRTRVERLALVGISVPMPVNDAFLAAARDDSAAGFDMQAVWGHARDTLFATSAIPGTFLLGSTRRLNGRAHAGVLHADLAACDAYRPAPEAIRALDVPTLVLAGRADQMTPYRGGEAVAREIPGARLVGVDAGHSMMTEAPRETLAALRRFLAPHG